MPDYSNREEPRITVHRVDNDTVDVTIVAPAPKVRLINQQTGEVIQGGSGDQSIIEFTRRVKIENAENT